MSKKILILDSSAIINGYNPASSMKKHIISKKAAEEIKDLKSKQILERAIEVEKLMILEAKREKVREVEKVAFKTGDLGYLSAADLETLALALEMREQGLEPIILTDDFSIQNVAKHLNIRVVSIITTGIKRMIKWIKYCPACGAVYTNRNIKKCQICGTTLKRKPKS